MVRVFERIVSCIVIRKVPERRKLSGKQQGERAKKERHAWNNMSFVK